MADNLTVTAKIGETGKVITVVLKDTDPTTGLLAPQNLTGYTNLKMQVETNGDEVIINEAACVADADQTANPGKITCTTDITVAAHPNLRTGDFRLEFNGLNSSGKKRFWPMSVNQKRTYGRFTVQKSLG